MMANARDDNPGDPIDAEITRLSDLSRELIDAYLRWNSKIIHGETMFSLYGDISDFVNFRVETAATCLDLVSGRRIADCLGLGRSLLENYLLLKLLCRGDKYFQLQDMSNKTVPDLKDYLAEQQKDLAAKHAAGESLHCLYVAPYPREKKTLMYVFEGLQDSGNPDFRIPIHHFQFQEFNPQTMRLRDEDYFTYYEPEQSTKDARHRFQNEAKYRYRHYLSYDALLQCLQINDLADLAAIKRIDAHYTFLGTFLHPTHDAARDLHVQSNVHSGQMAIGMNQRYEPAAALLAALYVSQILAGMIGELAGFYDKASNEYFKDPGTAEVKKLAQELQESAPYFWFIDNEASLYDKFNHAVNVATDEDLRAHGGYQGIPSNQVKFESDIYSHLKAALGGWSNMRVGSYTPPIAN